MTGGSDSIFSLKRNQASGEGGQISYNHCKGSSTKIKGSDQKFHKKRVKHQEKGVYLAEGVTFFVSGVIFGITRGQAPR